MSAPDLVASLNAYFTEFTRIAIERGAYLDKYIGDGVMAVWGAPQGSGDHAAAACLAALELRERLAMLPWSWLPEGAPKPQTRMGINSGEMVVGMVGSNKGIAHYTVMGDNVVVAARLEGANKIYGTRILIGEGCLDKLRGRVATREIDLVVLKGKSRPLRVYEPICVAEAQTEGIRSKIERFEAALGFYRTRRWAEAEAAFRSVLESDPGDGPAQVFVERCRSFLREAPGPDWRGEFVMTAK
jgi:adenylate cyclase